MEAILSSDLSSLLTIYLGPPAVLRDEFAVDTDEHIRVSRLITKCKCGSADHPGRKGGWPNNKLFRFVRGDHYGVVLDLAKQTDFVLPQPGEVLCREHAVTILTWLVSCFEVQFQNNSGTPESRTALARETAIGFFSSIAWEASVSRAMERQAAADRAVYEKTFDYAFGTAFGTGSTEAIRLRAISEFPVFERCPCRLCANGVVAKEHKAGDIFRVWLKQHLLREIPLNDSGVSPLSPEASVVLCDLRAFKSEHVFVCREHALVLFLDLACYFGLQVIEGAFEPAAAYYLRTWSGQGQRGFRRNFDAWKALLKPKVPTPPPSANGHNGAAVRLSRQQRRTVNGWDQMQLAKAAQLQQQQHI